MSAIRRVNAIKATLMTLGLVFFQAALSQDVQVNSADPSTAPQGTINLDVTIAGEGFDNSGEVFFFKTGTSDPAGVTVNSTKVRGPKKAIANIDIAPDAEIADYDIELRMSRGRGGKGTELFSVHSANSGNETGSVACSDGIDNDGDGKIDSEDEDCAGAGKPDRDKDKRGTAIPLDVTLDDAFGDSLTSDGDGTYRDGERKVVAVAGESLPSRLYFHPQNVTKNHRTVTVEVACEAIPDTGAGDAIDQCSTLTALYGDPFSFTGGYITGVIPYSLNCPEGTDPCDDVFSMGASTRLFSFKLLSGTAPIIESASDIGGATAVEAGRCLSLLPSSQRDHFVNNVCADPADCNVTVTADDLDSDGEADDWMVDGVAITALICDGDTVYGQTMLQIGFHAGTQ